MSQFGNSRGEERLRPKSGFTLVEVLLALAIFAMATVVLASTYVNILISVHAVKEDLPMQQALALVRSQVLQEPDLQVVQAGGQVSTQNMGTADWTAEVDPTEVADLFSLNLSVSFDKDNSGKPKVVTEHLYVLRPTWSDPTDRQQLRAQTKERFEEQKRSRPR